MKSLPQIPQNGFLDGKVRPHTSIWTKGKIASFGGTTLLHPPHSPDLVFFGTGNKDLLSKRVSDEEVKSEVVKFSKNSQQNFTRLGYMISLEGWTLILRETVTIFRKEMIHRRPFTFWCMIPITASVIIPILKIKCLTFWLTLAKKTKHYWPAHKLGFQRKKKKNDFIITIGHRTLLRLPWLSNKYSYLIKEIERFVSCFIAVDLIFAVKCTVFHT